MAVHSFCPCSPLVMLKIQLAFIGGLQVKSLDVSSKSEAKFELEDRGRLHSARWKTSIGGKGN